MAKSLNLTLYTSTSLLRRTNYAVLAGQTVVVGNWVTIDTTPEASLSSANGAANIDCWLAFQDNSDPDAALVGIAVLEGGPIDILVNTNGYTGNILKGASLTTENGLLVTAIAGDYVYGTAVQAASSAAGDSLRALVSSGQPLWIEP